jgi:hypothetical protein
MKEFEKFSLKNFCRRQIMGPNSHHSGFELLSLYYNANEEKRISETLLFQEQPFDQSEA